MADRNDEGKRVRIINSPWIGKSLSGKTGTIIKRDDIPMHNWNIWVELDEPVLGSKIYAFNRWELRGLSPQ
jgi:hypothetical protein